MELHFDIEGGHAAQEPGELVGAERTPVTHRQAKLCQSRFELGVDGEGR
jgi:hypothetical protein